MRPAVSLCMIVRDEQDNLRECLAPVRDMVSEIIIVDTGSQDRTREVARESGAKVFDFPWTDDFAAARNHVLKHATGDWIFWLDADDRIDPDNARRLAEVFRQLENKDPHAASIYLISVLIREPGSASVSPMGQARLFAARAGLHWSGVVHEHIVDASGGCEALNASSTDVTIRHTGYDDLELHQRKLQRNLQLLQKGYLLDPGDPMVTYYLGHGHAIRGDRVTALRFYRRSIRNDPRKAFLSTRLAYCGAADCLLNLGRTSEALALCREALAFFPTQPELLQAAAMALAKCNLLHEAEECLRKLLALPRNALSLTGDVKDSVRLQARLFLAEMVRQQGRWQESEEICRAIGLEAPDTPGAWVGIGQIGVATGRPALIEEAIERLAAIAGATTLLTLLRAQLAIHRKQWDLARGFVAVVLSEDPEHSDGLLLLSDILYQNCVDLPAAIAAHRKVLERMPERADIRGKLAILEARTGSATVAASSGNPFFVTFGKPGTPAAKPLSVA